MAAIEWGKDPEEFWALPEETQAVMIAFAIARSEMRTYEDDQVRPPAMPDLPRMPRSPRI